jgi:hypothetical protein
LNAEKASLALLVRLSDIEYQAIIIYHKYTYFKLLEKTSIQLPLLVVQKKGLSLPVKEILIGTSSRSYLS